MSAADKVFNALKNELDIEGAVGSIHFQLGDFDIIVEQNDIVGNILEEWIGKWMTSKGIPNKHNQKQASPDFWLNLEDDRADWLEVKSFTNSPNFDVSAFKSFVKVVVDQPWKLRSKYLLIKYKMVGGVITIEQIWLKNIWEICCSSKTWPLKVQYKNGQIVNIRPATWYSENAGFKTFSCLEHFLAALEETIYKCHETRTTLAETWAVKLQQNYEAYYHKKLVIPRWNDIKFQYILN